jgi:ribosomal-protein-alanine N-acetyltransferase
MHIEREIECGACRLRALRETDAEALARHANNPRVAAHLRDRFPHPYGVDDARRFLKYVETTAEECVAAIEVEGEAAGAIGVQFRADIERCSAELGYWLGEKYWGRGIMTEAIRGFTGWAMPRFALTRVYAEVFAENPASGKVLEKAGFERVGVLRKAAIKHEVHRDYVLWDLVR